MPNAACAVFKCTNSTNKLTKIKKELCQKHQQQRKLCGCLPFTHFKFPSESELVKKWTELINRNKSAEGSECWTPDKSSVVCSVHFIDGRPTEKNPLPVVDMGYHVTDAAKKCKIKRKTLNSSLGVRNVKNGKTEVQAHLFEHEDLFVGAKASVCSPKDVPASATSWETSTASCSYDSNSNSKVKSEPKDIITLKRPKTISQRDGGHINRRVQVNASLLLKMRTAQLRQFLKPKHQLLLKTDKDVLFFTGIPTLKAFKVIVTYVKHYQQAETRRRKKSSLYKYAELMKMKAHKAKKGKELCTEDKILMTLMKLRLGLLHKDMAHRFDVTIALVCSIFAEFTQLLSKALRPLIVFYTQGDIQNTIPKEYKNFPNLRCIIDCSEILIQKPTDLRMQAATWSDYKSHNTVKFLIAITPQGSICYVSELYGGRSSDKHLVRDSKFLDCLHPQDVVLADRGFGVREEVMLKGATLVIPPAKRGSDQMTSDDIRKTKRVANVRIHIERAIRRVKTFRFITNTVSITMLKYCDDILQIVSALANLQGPLVKSWKPQVDEEMKS